MKQKKTIKQRKIQKVNMIIEVNIKVRNNMSLMAPVALAEDKDEMKMHLSYVDWAIANGLPRSKK